MAIESSKSKMLEESLPTQDGQPISLLVLHDYSISRRKWRETLRELFNKFGEFKIQIPESRREALEIIKTKSVDFITVELQFGMKSLEGIFDDGSSFVAAAREAGFKGNIAFTSYPIAPEEN